jgi:hypothetical protein
MHDQPLLPTTGTPSKHEQHIHDDVYQSRSYVQPLVLFLIITVVLSDPNLLTTCGSQTTTENIACFINE